MLAGIISNLGLLIARLTSARAGYLDKLNITGDVLDDTVWTDARATKLDNLDAAVSGVGGGAGQLVKSVYGGTSSATLITLLDYTSGGGTLIGITFKVDPPGGSLPDQLKITIDSQTGQELFGNNIDYVNDLSGAVWFHTRFTASCKVEIAVAGATFYNLFYSIDI